MTSIFSGSRISSSVASLWVCRHLFCPSMISVLLPFFYVCLCLWCCYFAFFCFSVDLKQSCADRNQAWDMWAICVHILPYFIFLTFGCMWWNCMQKNGLNIYFEGFNIWKLCWSSFTRSKCRTVYSLDILRHFYFAKAWVTSVFQQTSQKKYQKFMKWINSSEMRTWLSWHWLSFSHLNQFGSQIC